MSSGRLRDVFSMSISIQLMSLRYLKSERRHILRAQYINWTDRDILKTSFRISKDVYVHMPVGLSQRIPECEIVFFNKVSRLRLESLNIPAVHPTKQKTVMKIKDQNVTPIKQYEFFVTPTPRFTAISKRSFFADPLLICLLL